MKKEFFIGGYNYSGYNIETDFKHADGVKRGVIEAISNNAYKVLKNIDLNLLALRLFHKIADEYSDENLERFAKTLFKNSEDITLDMLDIDMIVQDYARTISNNYIKGLQDKFDCFIKNIYEID